MGRRCGRFWVQRMKNPGRDRDNTDRGPSAKARAKEIAMHGGPRFNGFSDFYRPMLGRSLSSYSPASWRSPVDSARTAWTGSAATIRERCRPEWPGRVNEVI